MTLKLLFFSAIISQTITAAIAIKCYQCNSAINEECHNLSLFKPHLTAGFYKECTDFETYNGTTPFCRKTELLIKFADVRRTVRSCGWIKSSQSCMKADQDDHGELQCQCFEDGCNGSSQVKTFGVLTLIVVNLFSLFH